MTACRLLYLKPLICGRRPTLPDFHWVQRSSVKCHIPCSSTNGSSMIVVSGTPVKVHPIKKWDKGSLGNGTSCQVECRICWPLCLWTLCDLQLSSVECRDEKSSSKAWIQTGLALSSLFGTVAQHSIDVIIAWALIGEWSSRVLFPPPDGQWPRHGHPQLHWGILCAKGT